MINLNDDNDKFSLRIITWAIGQLALEVLLEVLWPSTAPENKFERKKKTSALYPSWPGRARTQYLFCPFYTFLLPVKK